MKKLLIVCAALLAASGCLNAQGKDWDFTVSPQLITETDESPTVLGLHYDFAYEPLRWMFDEEALSTAHIKVRSSGTIVPEGKPNPLNLIESRAEGYLQWFPSENFILRGGVQASMESNQRFTRKQFLYAGKLGCVYAIGDRGSSFGVNAVFGNVHPVADPLRKEALAGAAPGDYQRVDVELFVQWIMDTELIKKVEFLGRYYYETAPSDAVRDADLDRFSMHTLRIHLPNNLYLTYADGRFPFDLTVDQVLLLGLSVLVN
ncbi:MAG: hypothetical protein RRA94_06285 [Bacteroidota bacterium]|nr:hypothetical protein [Bacteroidota bacterium]